MVYVYNAITNRYFKGDIEITKGEYVIGVAKTKEAFSYALKKFQGEAVDVPPELVELVEMQISALEANIPDETDEEATAEDYEEALREMGVKV